MVLFVRIKEDYYFDDYLSFNLGKFHFECSNSKSFINYTLLGKLKYQLLVKHEYLTIFVALITTQNVDMHFA